MSAAQHLELAPFLIAPTMIADSFREGMTMGGRHPATSTGVGSGSSVKVSKEWAIAMTKRKAYEMGFRHVADLAAINRVAELIRGNDEDDTAMALMEAWREGALAAKALLERESATLQ